MKYVIVNDKKFELIENVKDGFELEEVSNKLTEFFDVYDYILGDWAYGKLRLKGFCNKQNKHCKPINDYANKDDYLKNNCAYGCRYFILEKIKGE